MKQQPKENDLQSEIENERWKPPRENLKVVSGSRAQQTVQTVRNQVPGNQKASKTLGEKNTETFRRVAHM